MNANQKLFLTSVRDVSIVIFALVAVVLVWMYSPNWLLLTLGAIILFVFACVMVYRIRLDRREREESMRNLAAIEAEHWEKLNNRTWAGNKDV